MEWKLEILGLQCLIEEAEVELWLWCPQVTEPSRCRSGFGIVSILIENNGYFMVP